MKIKKLCALVLSALSFISAFAFSGCSACRTEAEMVEEKSFVDGYFKYYYIKETDSYAIVGDGDVPYPETFAIPAYYNGKVITHVAYSVATGIMATKYLGPSLLGVEEVWFPYTSSDFFEFHADYDTSYGYIEFGSPQKYFIVNTANISALSISEGGNYPKEMYFSPVYYKRFIYDTIDKYDYVSVWRDGSGRCQIANTSYMFNYEGAPNDGYFFINDFERGGFIENTPYAPQREGYTFGGWYKDTECKTKWDFEKDKLPEAAYDEDGYVTDFVETKLYAKWIKN